MPDILIRGMAMPTEPTAITIFPNGDVYDFFADDKLGVAKELPPHGDLISKQTVLAALYSDYAYAAMDIIEKEVPVVVPAERRDADA